MSGPPSPLRNGPVPERVPRHLFLFREVPLAIPRACQLSLICLSLLVATSAFVRAEDAKPRFTSEQLDFFETSVRPLLLTECIRCHGDKKQWAGLRLDSRHRMLTGGESGPAIIPGKPAESLLIEAVQRTGLEMPPDKELSPEQVKILIKWVEMGAPWPDQPNEETDTNQAARDHWALQPIKKVTPPDVAGDPPIYNDIDRFVQAKLSEAKLQGAPRSDPRTLIRRVSYGLTGLPPAFKDVRNFEQDPSPQAFGKLVEQYLSSPQYGEHWGRKWLDLARYADTKGYVYNREERRSLHAWTYRDWVVKALNEDLPYDQFLKLQIAADQIAPDDPSAQAAMGFLTVGRRFLGNPHDIIDDRIDVLCRTTMGLTVQCARCHDHKYDPIPTADYYSLYGVFQNCTEQIVPVTPAKKNTKPTKFEAELQKRQQAFRDAMEQASLEASQRARGRLADYLFAQSELEKYPDLSFNLILGVDDVIPLFVHRWEAYLRHAKNVKDPIFLPWFQFVELPADNFGPLAVEVTQRLQTESASAVHPLVLPLFDTPPTSLREVAERYQSLFQSIDQKWTQALEDAEKESLPPPDGLPVPEEEQLRKVLYGPTSPCSLPDDSIVSTEYFFDQKVGDRLWKLQVAIEKWLIEGPDATPHTIRLIDRKLLEEPLIFRRGNPANKGEEVSRHFLTAIAGENPPPFQIGSGRLELAEAIASPSNPLTARVWVNRIWQHHFGVGLVPTPSDFGTRAPEPVHLELLDWLAGELIDSGWSTKHIQRLILNSATYQQNSLGPKDPAERERCLVQDPENTLLWKMRPHRLTFEEFRDSMLMASGSLDLTLGGRPSELFPPDDGNHRRTLYGLVDRQFLPAVFRVFDFANPDLHLPVRAETTVSQQALFAMNHPFMADRATALIRSIEPEAFSDQQKIEALFVRLFQRIPSDWEMEAAVQFLNRADQMEEHQPSPQQAAWKYGYASVDEEGTSVRNFQPLPYFTGSSWQGGPKYPDGSLGWAQLHADGGHPGNDHDHAVVRRWTAPKAGVLSIQSHANHEQKPGNGIRCRIISNRQGLFREFALHQSSKEETIKDIPVQSGEIIDFVVDINGNLHSDEFLWTVELELTDNGSSGLSSENRQTWNSKKDFTGVGQMQLRPWEQLAQVLLLSNEFLFVD